MKKRISPLLTAILVVAALVFQTGDAAAQKRTFIRDAEIENTIRQFATPVFQVAGLDPSAIEIYLVKDSQINAFVAGGQKLFLYTGLLMKVEHAGQLIGVIAHETGHIAGGHLSQTQEALRNSTAQQILATVIGAAAGVASGRADVGGAIILGGQSAAQGSFLHYSRTQEGAADAAATRFLDASGQSSRGMLEFLQSLADQELLSARHQDPYLLTHPLTSDRISAIGNHVANSRYSDNPIPPAFAEMFDRMKAKLQAFLDPPARTLRQYKEDDKSVAARYARAVAYYRIPELDKALPLIDGLIAEEPQNPFFYELKGQMLFENARVTEALEPYRMAVKLVPRSSLIRVQLARVELESNDPALLDDAIENLSMAVKTEPDVPTLWRNLAIAYGRKGDMANSALAMAEEAYYRGNKRDARFHAGKAKDMLPTGSPGALRADDILAATAEKDDDKKK